MAIDFVASSFARNRKINFIRIAVGINHSKSCDAQTLCFCKCNMLMTDVDDEQSCRYTAQLGRYHPILFPFYPGRAVSVRRSFLVRLSALPSFSILSMLCIFFTLLRTVLKLVSIPPKPTLGNERHVYSACAFSNNFFCLFFSTNEHDLLYRCVRSAFNAASSFLQTFSCFIQIDDMNTFLFSKNVRQHLWVPLLSQVTKMYTCFK